MFENNISRFLILDSSEGLVIPSKSVRGLGFFLDFFGFFYLFFWDFFLKSERDFFRVVCLPLGFLCFR